MPARGDKTPKPAPAPSGNNSSDAPGPRTGGTRSQQTTGKREMADARAKAEAADNKEGNGGDRKGKGRAKARKRVAHSAVVVDSSHTVAGGHVAPFGILTGKVDEGDICVMEAWSIDIVKTFFNKGVKAIAKWLTKLHFLQIDLLDDKVINFKQVAIDLKLPDVVKKAAAAVWDVNYRNDQLAFKPGFNPNKVQIGLLSHNLDPP